jgi:hypothetical protein
METERLLVENADFHFIIHVISNWFGPELVDPLNLDKLDQPVLKFFYDVRTYPFHLYESDCASFFLLRVWV